MKKKKANRFLIEFILENVFILAYLHMVKYGVLNMQKQKQ